MKLTTKQTTFLIGTALLAGCFTTSETPYPNTALLSASATNIAVRVEGFQSTIRQYISVGGYQSYYVPGTWHHPGGFANVYTTTSVPTAQATDRFYQQIRNRLEDAGFILGAQEPDYVIEGHFAGPIRGDNNPSFRFLWNVLSIFTYDGNTTQWQLQLKIRSNRTGRLLFSHVYDQVFEVGCFSPIPIFGILNYDKTDDTYGQTWCQAVLTDRAAADIASFLLKAGK